jgi:sugar O-acyltransferase (sialic acid O-acetyltransferase NeuD family)
MIEKQKNRLIIIGASGHGKVVADIAYRNGYKDIAFLDDRKSLVECIGYPVLDVVDMAECYSNADFAIGVGNTRIRERIQKNLIEKGLNLVTLIHPQATIGMHVSIGIGTVVMAGAVISPDTVIGDGCIINTSASVDHDNRLDDYTHISVGSHLAGNVTVGRSTWIGIGAVVSNNINICAGCMIGAGAVVIRDIKVPGVYIGVPAIIKQ